jgi:hypothetical protein
MTILLCRAVAKLHRHYVGTRLLDSNTWRCYGAQLTVRNAACLLRSARKGSGEPLRALLCRVYNHMLLRREFCHQFTAEPGLVSSKRTGVERQARCPGRAELRSLGDRTGRGAEISQPVTATSEKG